MELNKTAAGVAVFAINEGTFMQREKLSQIPYLVLVKHTCIEEKINNINIILFLHLTAQGQVRCRLTGCTTLGYVGKG